MRLSDYNLEDLKDEVKKREKIVNNIPKAQDQIPW